VVPPQFAVSKARPRGPVTGASRRVLLETHQLTGVVTVQSRAREGLAWVRRSSRTDHDSLAVGVTTPRLRQRAGARIGRVSIRVNRARFGDVAQRISTFFERIAQRGAAAST
jgi:hypothetical protein